MLAGKKLRFKKRPILRIIIFIYLLIEPNDESGANIDACKLWRSDREKFNEIVYGNVRKSLGME